mmetsp:Transcript_44527/g.104035  ORF Transcript_44527/g.104035 Transcript_44527/m.104035 type:complete len:370 (+) Transcript_44527:283-1392(+)
MVWTIGVFVTSDQASAESLNAHHLESEGFQTIPRLALPQLFKGHIFRLALEHPLRPLGRADVPEQGIVEATVLIVVQDVPLLSDFAWLRAARHTSVNVVHAPCVRNEGLALDHSFEPHTGQRIWPRHPVCRVAGVAEPLQLKHVRLRLGFHYLLQAELRRSQKLIHIHINDPVFRDCGVVQLLELLRVGCTQESDPLLVAQGIDLVCDELLLARVSAEEVNAVCGQLVDVVAKERLQVGQFCSIDTSGDGKRVSLLMMSSVLHLHLQQRRVLWDVLYQLPFLVEGKLNFVARCLGPMTATVVGPELRHRYRLQHLRHGSRLDISAGLLRVAKQPVEGLPQGLFVSTIALVRLHLHYPIQACLGQCLRLE